MKPQPTPVRVLTMIGNIKVIDNKELNWSEHSTIPGVSCANCRHYNAYEVETEPVEHNMDDDPIYIGPIVTNGSCTQPEHDDMFIFNVPSTHRCPKYDYRENDQFVDDAIIDDMEGREV